MRAYISRLVIILFLFSLITSGLMLSVSADLLPPNSKTVSPCVEIENINDYKDYKFFLISDLVRGIEMVEEGECTDLIYKMGDHYLLAIPENEIESAWLELNSDVTFSGEDRIKSHPETLKSETLDLPESKTVSEVDPSDGSHEVFKVSIDGDELSLEKTSSTSSSDYSVTLILILIFCCFIAFVAFSLIVLKLLVLDKKPTKGNK